MTPRAVHDARYEIFTEQRPRPFRRLQLPAESKTPVLTLRSLRWPDDRHALCALGTSLTAERVYRAVATAKAFTLQDTTVSPALHKVYDLTDEIEGIPALDHALLAECDTRVTGVAALSLDVADQRAIVRHLYVGRAYRGQGIGRALMDAMAARAKQWQARCLWLETQDVNYAAIQFYQRAGFQWCGLDLSLDERNGSATDEAAVLFMRLRE